MSSPSILTNGFVRKSWVHREH